MDRHYKQKDSSKFMWHHWQKFNGLENTRYNCI